MRLKSFSLAYTGDTCFIVVSMLTTVDMTLAGPDGARVNFWAERGHFDESMNLYLVCVREP